MRLTDYCCLTSWCIPALQLHLRFEEGDDCPELYWNGEKYRCKLAELPGKKGEEYRKLLDIGEGCCSTLNTWRLDVRERFDHDLFKGFQSNSEAQGG